MCVVTRFVCEHRKFFGVWECASDAQIKDSNNVVCFFLFVSFCIFYLYVELSGDFGCIHVSFLY